jgi:hypothetical protein
VEHLVRLSQQRGQEFTEKLYNSTLIGQQRCRRQSRQSEEPVDIRYSIGWLFQSWQSTNPIRGLLTSVFGSAF